MTSRGAVQNSCFPPCAGSPQPAQHGPATNATDVLLDGRTFPFPKARSGLLAPFFGRPRFGLPREGADLVLGQPGGRCDPGLIILGRWFESTTPGKTNLHQGDRLWRK